jgi:CRISPR-associated protein Csb2
MPAYVAVKIYLLDATFHGQRDRGEPEWPPSPLRVFQSLVAAAAGQARGDGIPESAGRALKWLERQAPPAILAPPAHTSPASALSVPNNDMDVVARAWSRGNYFGSGDASPAAHRTFKVVRPTHFLDHQPVLYLWSLSGPQDGEIVEYVGVLNTIARSIVALGWGIDMAVGSACLLSQQEADVLSGKRWLPDSAMAGTALRVPAAGTLEALIDRHQRFLHRVGSDGLTVPPPLARFETVGYRCDDVPPARAYAAFSLLKLDGSGFQSFDSARRGLKVAGMVRGAVRRAAEQTARPESWIKRFVLGHGEPRDGSSHVAVGPRRFAYVPLPSLEARGDGKSRVVGAVRRVLVTTVAGDCEAEITWARRALAGQELLPDGGVEGVAILSLIPASDKLVRHYTERTSSCATVTPVVLPGFDDPAHLRRRLKKGVEAEAQQRLVAGLNNRIDALLRKAIMQAGFPVVLAENAEIEWRKAGFLPGVEWADRYGVPDHLERFPRYHVRINWRDGNGQPVRVAGPMCLGSGRFFGIGLFVAVP